MASRAELAERMGKRESNLHASLYGRPSADRATITRSFLQDLERALVALPQATEIEPHIRRPLATLVGLREELAEEGDADAGVRVHGAWFGELCATGPARDAVEAIVRGEALRDLVQEARDRRETERLLTGPLGEHARQTLVDLLAVTGLPPTVGASAINVLARLGLPAVAEIGREVYQSPMGFRSLRALTRMLWRVRLRRAGHAEGFPLASGERELLDEIEDVLLAVEERPPADPYPATGLVVEALRFAPAEWDWVDAAIVARARDGERPVRERMFALAVAADRAVRDVDSLLADVGGQPGDEEGLAWAAAVLSHRGDQAPAEWLAPPSSVHGRRLWPWPPGRPEPAAVQVVLDALDDADPALLPGSVRDGTKVLVAEALLTLDETRRRRALDVLNVAHVSGVAATAISAMPRDPDRVPRWLRERTAFVLGYLQGHDSLPRLREIVAAGTEHPAVLHAAAWGIGDTCGTGAWRTHRHCVPVDDLAALLRHPAPGPRHAAAYTLGVTRQPGARPALADVATDPHADRTTVALARWGLRVFDTERVKARADAPMCLPDSRTYLHADR
ncbi:hypothetical protein [Actinomycetospora sp. NBRC 106375]|uniref:hypothetical protein n=1 Tax=Actinomycetospora sp. NBRC 106375 TaxID=3032207 RepID=UPI002554144F|nr:hypothetical protein [Actinomycetospora sp. NBRC 106375]